MATDSKGRLYTSSTDGLIKCFENPRSSDFSQELSKSFDELYCLISVEDDIYVGDDKGNVSKDRERGRGDPERDVEDPPCAVTEAIFLVKNSSSSCAMNFYQIL